MKLVISSRNPDDDFAILGCSTDHAYLPAYQGAPDCLRGDELVLAGYCIGLGGHSVPMFSRRLGFSKAAGISLSPCARQWFFSCPTFAGNAGQAVILKGGNLVGIHQEGVNALRERLHANIRCKVRLTATEKSLDAILSRGLSQSCCALLSHAFLMTSIKGLPSSAKQS